MSVGAGLGTQGSTEKGGTLFAPSNICTEKKLVLGVALGFVSLKPT